MRKARHWRCAPRYLWAAPISLIGLGLALLALLSRGRAHWHTGVLEVAGGLPGYLLHWRWPGSGPVSAITLGHVVLAVSPQDLALTRQHERVHVAQMERWGAMFLVAYPLFSLITLARGGDLYRDNPFEIEARRVAGY